MTHGPRLDGVVGESSPDVMVIEAVIAPHNVGKAPGTQVNTVDMRSMYDE